MDKLVDQGRFLLYPAGKSPFDSLNHFSQRSKLSGCEKRGWKKGRRRRHREGSSCLRLVSHHRLLCESGTTGKRKRGRERAGGGRGGRREEEGGWGRRTFAYRSGWRQWEGRARDPVKLSVLHLPVTFISLCLFSPPALPPGAFLTSSHSSSATVPSLAAHPPFRRPAPLHQPPQDFMIPLNDRWDALDSAFSPLGSPPRVASAPESWAGQRLEGGEVAPPAPGLSWNVCVGSMDETWHSDEQAALWMGGVSCSETHLFAQRRFERVFCSERGLKRSSSDHFPLLLY